MKEVKKSKGVKKKKKKKSALEKLSINDYKACLFNSKIISDEMILFRSKTHQLYTQKLSKIVLSFADDKRDIRPNKTTTYAHGHYKLIKYNNLYSNYNIDDKTTNVNYKESLDVMNYDNFMDVDL